MNLVSFRNRLLVFIQWGWSYISYDRAARLITEPEARTITASNSTASRPNTDGAASGVETPPGVCKEV
jgi:hypothetical protein